MKTEQTKTRAQELAERHAKELAECQAKEAIETLLPESLPLPTISNINDKPGKTRAWLSFHAPYGTDEKAFALSVFTELEKAGAKIVPLSLCKWDQWRRVVEPGHVDSIPEEKPDGGQRTKKLTDIDPIAPLWVEPNQYTGVEAKCFYEINGQLFKIHVKVPLPARLSCHRIENMGGWRFDGPCSVLFPQGWHSIHTESGESVANISQHTHGYRDTEQGISGTIYWQPLTEQESFPLSPAQFLAQLFLSK